MVAEQPERGKYLADTYSVLVTSVLDAVEHATYVIVAVKPTDVDLVIGDVAEAGGKAESGSAEQVFRTIAAGVTTAFYENKLPAGAPVIRVMPNAPALVGAGVSALAPAGSPAPSSGGRCPSLFNAVGGVLTVTEAQMDTVTAMSGSGPATF